MSIKTILIRANLSSTIGTCHLDTVKQYLIVNKKDVICMELTNGT